MRRSSTLIAAAAVCSIVLVAGAIGTARTSQPSSPADATDSQIAAVSETYERASGSSLATTIASLEARLAATPNDDVGWASLALAYVQQARIDVDPTYYPRAEAALETSFEVNDDDNYLGYAGRSALAAGRHDFLAANEFAEKGLEINPYSALLHGLQSDAQTQLGDYQAAFESVQKMLDLSPDTASLSRASYTFELRGNLDRARELMQRALDDAPTDADRAFALHHLGQLAFDAGDPNTALEYELRALSFSPDDPAAQFGRAMAEAALGQTETALAHLDDLVRRVPLPGYLTAYGDLLTSVGRDEEAANQYAVVDAAIALFADNGELPDADVVHFQIASGAVDEALSTAESMVKIRPFVSSQDAYAWALHAAGRHSEALDQIEAALSLGTRSAPLYYHSGMIRLALGDTTGAHDDLTTALEINPYFHPIDAARAADQLELIAGRARP